MTWPTTNSFYTDSIFHCLDFWSEAKELCSNALMNPLSMVTSLCICANLTSSHHQYSICISVLPSFLWDFWLTCWCNVMRPKCQSHSYSLNVVGGIVSFHWSSFGTLAVRPGHPHGDLLIWWCSDILVFHRRIMFQGSEWHKILGFWFLTLWLSWFESLLHYCNEQ
jgi:hypothetical protein